MYFMHFHDNFQLEVYLVLLLAHCGTFAPAYELDLTATTTTNTLTCT